MLKGQMQTYVMRRVCLVLASPALHGGRRCLRGQPSSRTGENPPYGMIGGTVETSASFEARYGPLSHPTIDEDFGCTRAEESSSTGSTFRAGSNPLSSTMIPKNLLVS